jgi:hypothetical protein
MKFSSKPAEAPLAAEGGMQVAVGEPADPYQAVDELMVAVEALCPRWPERPPFPSSARFLL